MHVRSYQDSDLELLVRLFMASVHELAAPFYNEAQRAAWAPASPDRPAWSARLGAGTLVAAADGDPKPLGFLLHDHAGYVDLLYVAPTAARLGVASALLEAALATWIARGVVRSHTEASLAARAFFERHGYRVVETQHVERAGQTLSRFCMERLLIPTP